MAGKAKKLAVYAVRETGSQSHWTRVGSAFENRDGSITLYLDAMPLGTNKLQVREARQATEPGPGEARS